MGIVQCRYGHYYDDAKDRECPVCQALKNGSAEDEKTVHFSSDIEWLTALNTAQKIRLGKEEITAGTDPARLYPVGWLVIVGGERIGQDFRICRGINYAGRDPSSDIMIADATVGRINHFSIVFDEKDLGYYLMPGKGSNTFLNGELLLETRPVARHDRITAGNTVLEFIPFCDGGVYQWKTEAK